MTDRRHASTRGTGPPALDRRALLLFHGTADDVLRRIVPDDPLGLARLVASELRRQAYLLDAERVLCRTLARCARAAASWRGVPELAVWLGERVSEALADVLRLEHVRDAGTSDAFGQIARPLGLHSGSLREACARFNALEGDVRQALHAVLLEGESLPCFARRQGITVGEAARRARRGLEVFRCAELDRARRPDRQAS